jgi:ribosomal protein L29
MQKKDLDCMQKRQIGQKTIAIQEHGHNNAATRVQKANQNVGSPRRIATVKK